MNFDEAIQTHAEWKQKLSIYLKKPDRSLDPIKVGRDDGCALGCWIHQGGGPLGTSPEFPQLKAAHTSFHKAAAEVVAGGEEAGVLPGGLEHAALELVVGGGALEQELGAGLHGGAAAGRGLEVAGQLELPGAVLGDMS